MDQSAIGRFDMKNFLAVFIGSTNSAAHAEWKSLSAEERTEKEKMGIMAWKNWAAKNERVIAEHGSPLGKTKKIDPKGISDIKNNLTAFTVVQAESHEAAAKLFLNHPHFSIFPGDSIEIMECLPIPGN
jgi:hypothetical protein